MHAKSGLRVVLKWKICRPDSVIADVIHPYKSPVMSSDISEFEQLVSFGQYLHWSLLQFAHFETFDEHSKDADFCGAMVHWVASVYVGTEAWKQLGIPDPTLTDIIDKYDDLFQHMRRFRNAVYHFQRKPLGDKIVSFNRNPEAVAFVRALQFELQRFLVNSVPQGKVGEELRLAIGWWPDCSLAQCKATGTESGVELNPAIQFLTRIPTTGG